MESKLSKTENLKSELRDKILSLLTLADLSQELNLCEVHEDILQSWDHLAKALERISTKETLNKTNV